MSQWLSARFCAALTCAVFSATCAQADDVIHELKFGILSHDVPKLWSGFRREPASADLNIEAQLKPSFALLGGTVRPALGGTINTDGQTSHVYIDAKWTFETPIGLFFTAGAGGALHDGAMNRLDPRSKALGSMALFHIPVEIGYRIDARNSISAYFEHTSNGNSQTFNEGLDRIGVRYGRLY